MQAGFIHGLAGLARKLFSQVTLICSTTAIRSEKLDRCDRIRSGNLSLVVVGLNSESAALRPQPSIGACLRCRPAALNAAKNEHVIGNKITVIIIHLTSAAHYS